jgi:hypothetical protein
MSEKCLQCPTAEGKHHLKDSERFLLHFIVLMLIIVSFKYLMLSFMNKIFYQAPPSTAQVSAVSTKRASRRLDE